MSQSSLTKSRFTDDATDLLSQSRRWVPGGGGGGEDDPGAGGASGMLRPTGTPGALLTLAGIAPENSSLALGKKGAFRCSFVMSYRGSRSSGRSAAGKTHPVLSSKSSADPESDSESEGGRLPRGSTVENDGSDQNDSASSLEKDAALASGISARLEEDPSWVGGAWRAGGGAWRGIARVWVGLWSGAGGEDWTGRPGDRLEGTRSQGAVL